MVFIKKNRTYRYPHVSVKIGVYLVLAIYAPMIYTALCIMLFMWAASITRASGRGLGPPVK
jgi:hypothetical protein